MLAHGRCLLRLPDTDVKDASKGDTSQLKLPVTTTMLLARIWILTSACGASQINSEMVLGSSTKGTQRRESDEARRDPSVVVQKIVDVVLAALLGSFLLMDESCAMA